MIGISDIRKMEIKAIEEYHGVNAKSIVAELEKKCGKQLAVRMAAAQLLLSLLARRKSNEKEILDQCRKHIKDTHS